MTPEGQVKLTDFGIARAVDGASHTRTGEIMGTPHYLSPEQGLGRPVTGASDLYSLGVVMHELLTGRKPFDRGTPIATMLSHVNEPPPPLPADVDADLAEIVRRCLEKDPTDRPPSAAAVAASLASVGRESDLAPDVGDARGDVRDGDDRAGAESLAVDVVEQHATGRWTPDWTEPQAPLRDLESLLANLSPELHDGTYAVVSVPVPIPDVHPFMTIEEAEGLTMLLRREEADAIGLPYELPLAWITLGVYRAIGSVGFVATATSALAQANIAAVAGVGRWHTHLFVPSTDAERAMKVLRRLSAAHRDDPS